MKTRSSFVSNSSSCSFCITNLTNKTLTVRDFILENPQLIEDFNKYYGFNYTLRDVLADSACKEKIKSGDNVMEFGDEYGGPVNSIFDYILRDGGRSERFIWSFLNYDR
ncbi:MAG: hypothetical protein WC185_04505 [Acholeplasmataceae bacterium]